MHCEKPMVNSADLGRRPQPVTESSTRTSSENFMENHFNGLRYISKDRLSRFITGLGKTPLANLLKLEVISNHGNRKQAA